MKRRVILKQLTISLIACLLFSTIGIAQKNEFSIKLRVPLQLEFQKEDINFPVVFLSKEQKTTVLNYGIDFLAEKELGKKLSAYIGVGYF